METIVEKSLHYMVDVQGFEGTMNEKKVHQDVSKYIPCNFKIGKVYIQINI